MVEYHHVNVPLARDVWKLSSLIGMHGLLWTVDFNEYVISFLIGFVFLVTSHCNLSLSFSSSNVISNICGLSFFIGYVELNP